MSGVRRVIAGVSGSPGNLQALRQAATLARVHHAALLPVHTWTPPGGDALDRGHPDSRLHRVWVDAAWQRLWAAMDLAFGGVPADLPFAPRVLRGDPGVVLVGAACRADDLLVVGAGRRGALRAIACRVSRYCLAHAQCPVVAVPPASLAQFGTGLRGWALRRRGLALPSGA